MFFESFNFLHINFFFIANVMTAFHARGNAVAWIAASLLPFYIDFTIRLMAKFKSVQVSEISVVGDSITKLVLRVDGFPLKRSTTTPGAMSG